MVQDPVEGYPWVLVGASWVPDFFRGPWFPAENEVTVSSGKRGPTRGCPTTLQYEPGSAAGYKTANSKKKFAKKCDRLFWTPIQLAFRTQQGPTRRRLLLTVPTNYAIGRGRAPASSDIL